MFFYWERHKQTHKWKLIHKESRTVVLELGASQYESTDQGEKLRRNVRKAYEKYYLSIFFETLKFF